MCSLLKSYVTLWPWPLILPPWIFVDQSVCQILTKSYNPRVSYNDLKIESLGPTGDPTLDFELSGFQSLRGLCRPIVHPHTLSRHWNQSVHGSVITIKTLKIRSRPHLGLIDFNVVALQYFCNFGWPMTHPHIKFERNRGIHGGVIAISICPIWVPSASLDFTLSGFPQFAASGDPYCISVKS